MVRTSNIDSNRITPYWNEIKKWSPKDKLKLIALISDSLVSDEKIENTDDEQPFGSQLSPELMQKLAEYGIKEHRAGHCISHDQVENSVMETMGWK